MKLQSDAHAGHDQHDAEAPEETIGRAVAGEKPHVHREEGEDQEERAQPQPGAEVMGGLGPVEAADVDGFHASGEGESRRRIGRVIAPQAQRQKDAECQQAQGQ